jgi:3-phosphoshikimate 1-carboxyvinyltransferase
VAGAVRPPGDKSITHRGLILGGLLRKPVRLLRPLAAGDTRSTARVLRQLGVTVTPLRLGGTVRIVGRRWRAPQGTLDCGNSGTTARLLLGALAGHPFEARLTGDASLRRRPMGRVTEPLSRMGVVFREQQQDRLPLTIRGGRLRSLLYESPVASAQVKSALLLAGLAGGVQVTVREPWRSRDHTERLLAYLGVDVVVREATVGMSGASFDPSHVPALDLEVPGDASSAAYLVAAAILAESGELAVRDVGVNPTRSGFLGVVARMGGRVAREAERECAGEPVADLVVRPGSLCGARVEPPEVPSLIDEVPILAVLASRAAGESSFRGVGELRVKESDRLSLLVANLRAVGVEAEAQDEALVVVGTERPPRGRVETAGDHRMAMAFAVLGTVPGAAVTLSETASVEISYPGFFADLRAIGDAA